MPDQQQEQRPQLSGSRTEANLRAAFTRESEASRRYVYFAQQADVEGHPDIAALFRSAADSESGHAIGHLDILAETGDPLTESPIGSTEENLASAVAAEQQEAEEMYPSFAEVARQEGFSEIADWMESLMSAESGIAERFATAARMFDDA